MTRRTWAATAAVLAAAAPASGPPPADDIRRKAAEIFERPEFGPPSSWSLAWFFRKLMEWFRALGGLYEYSPPLFWLVLVTLIVVLFLMIWLIVAQVRSVLVAERRYRGDAGPDARRVRQSVAYREEAARRADAGDYTEAIRFLFLSLIYRFDERGRVPLHGSYTNHEYLDLVGARLPVRDALRVLVDTLDEHWYGQRPCGRPQYEACLDVYERIAAA